MKYKDWLNEWLEYYVKPTTKSRTYMKYLRQIKNHIVPELGDFKLENLSARILQRFTVKLSEKGLAANTVNGIVSVLKSSLKRAVMLGVVHVQYSDTIVRPKAREKQIECFSKDEQRKIEKFVAESKKSKLFGIVLCLYTGLRIGELLALKWSDLNFPKGILSITKSCRDEWDNGRYVKITETPKTEHSYRLVPIPKQLMPRLKELKNQSGGEYIIGSRSVHGVEVRSYQRTFETVLQKLNLPHRGFHALRHTFATRALEVGMDVKTLSEVLGHSDPTVTLKRYAHSMIEHKMEMMNKLGQLLL